jgi:hypothetical protein
MAAEVERRIVDSSFRQVIRLAIVWQSFGKEKDGDARRPSRRPQDQI